MRAAVPMRIIVSLITAGIVLAGCTSDDDPAAESSSPTRAATSADSGPTLAEGAVLNTELVFARSEGIAGVDQRMVVRRDGSTTVVDGDQTHETRVAPEDLRQLAEGLATLDWDALQEASSSESSADDDFLFTLTQGEREVQITGNQLPARCLTPWSQHKKCWDACWTSDGQHSVATSAIASRGQDLA